MTPPLPLPGSVPEALDRQIGNLATRQHGVVSRRQLMRCGLSRSAIDARIRRGWLRPIHRGVYAVGHLDVSRHGRWLAAVLAGGARLPATAQAPPTAAHESGTGIVVLSHWSAAALHGLATRDPRVPEITTGSARPQRTGLRVHRSRSLTGSVTVRDGIPCTTVARTLVDISDDGNRRALQRSWATAAGRGLIRRAEIERELRISANRPGSALVREAYAEDFGYLTQRTRSDLERDALLLCRDFGLPQPHANRLIEIGEERFEADLLWPEPRLIVEVDGDRTHGHAVARRADRARDLRLQLAGWRTIRIGRAEISQRPRETAERLRAALAQPPLEPATDRSAPPTG